MSTITEIEAAAEALPTEQKRDLFLFLKARLHFSSMNEMEFKALAKQWREDTQFQSSQAEICFHPAYQSIMAMGNDALPFILQDLNSQFGHWFYALRNIVRKDMAEGATDLEDARRRWLNWGRKQKYLP